MSRAVLADMPAEMRDAYATFQHAPALVVNVALDNWRFLHTLGIACARWFDDEFGFSCNIRRPMVIGANAGADDAGRSRGPHLLHGPVRAGPAGWPSRA